ncbi:MAG: AMP-binding protein [Elusimicrobia bacterium]|nr:AMP-binding protein [Elusimicrobiota bacterium]
MLYLPHWLVASIAWAAPAASPLPPKDLAALLTVRTGGTAACRAAAPCVASEDQLDAAAVAERVAEVLPRLEEALAAGDPSRARAAVRSLLELPAVVTAGGDIRAADASRLLPRSRVEEAVALGLAALDSAERDARARDAREAGARMRSVAAGAAASIGAPAPDLADSAAPGAAAGSDRVGRVELPAGEDATSPGRSSTSARSPPAPALETPFLVRRHAALRALLGPSLGLFYRVKVEGAERLPKGPAILVVNHTALADGPLMNYAAGAPIRFWYHRKELTGLRGWLMRQLGGIPVHPTDSRSDLEEAMDLARQAIAKGETFVVFAEGDITRHGNLLRFRRGFDLLAKQTGAPVLPVHIDGLWGSVFSRREGPSLWSRLRELRRPVTVRIGEPLAEPAAQSAREAVQELAAESFERRILETRKPLPRAFLEAAKRFWSRRAVADSTGKDLTYGETLTGSLLLAGELKAKVRGTNVGILLPPSVGGALANVAVNSLGKTPVNLNYTAGKEGLGHAVAKAEIASIVTSRRFLEALKARGLEVPEADYVYLEDAVEAVPAWRKALTHAAVRVLPASLAARVFMPSAPKSLEETATILFTSGSSGKPKGVELSHKNVQANVEMLREVSPYHPRHVILGTLPFFHSFGYTATLWSALLQGHAAAYHHNPLETKAIAELAAKYKPTLLLSTPTFLAKYAQKIPAEAFAALKFVVAGAEKLRGDVADAFQRKFGVRPLEGYGATELSPVASSNLPDVGGQTGNKEGSVGHPLPGTAMRIVDPETREPLPWGKAGLLLVKGAHVMKGYHRDPEKTAEALQDGWYETGDIASIDRDGFVTLQGRLSRFSKIAGEMVSHVAVEEKLQEAAGLAEPSFAVVGVPDSKRGERLVAIYAGYEGAVSELAAKLRAAGVPNLWIPDERSFLKVEALPLLGSGKLDLQAVKKLAAAVGE